MSSRTGLPVTRPRSPARLAAAPSNPQNTAEASVRSSRVDSSGAASALSSASGTLAIEAAPDIRVNAVGPAAVDTAFLRGGTGRSGEDKPSHLNRDAYIAAARAGWELFREYGALSMTENWGDDVPEGKLNSMSTAVQCREDETVVLSWVTWPDKATRDAAMAKMMDPNNTDPRMDQEKNPMPFDGKRMIFGGFAPVVELEQ